MRPAAHGFRPEVLLEHREWARRAARALVFGDADADDLVQRAWLEVLARPPRTMPRDVRSWFRAVLKFTAIDAARETRSRMRHEQTAARPEPVQGAGPDVVSRAETIRRVASVVLELDEPYRTTVLLRYFDELPLREIAERQGVPLEPFLTIAGFVSWSDGRPVAGAVVSNEPSRNRGSQHTATGDDGRFVLRDLASGRHRLRVEHPDAQVLVLDDVAAGLQSVSVVLSPGASISGRVVDAEGRGVPQAGIFAQPAGRESPVYRAKSGSDGAFMLSGVECDSAYDLNVVPPAKPSSDVREPERYVNTVVRGVKADTSDLVVRQSEGSVIDGVLVDEAGHSLRAIELTATAVGRWTRTATTDAQGHFRFRGLQPGPHAITPGAAPGGLGAVRGGDAVTAGTSDLRLVGIAGAMLTGVVVDEKGRAIRNAIVDIESWRGRGILRTDRKGEFAARDLGREPTTVHVDAIGYVPATLRDVMPGATPMRITLVPGLEVFGRLLSADGTPLRARLDFRHPDPAARLLRQAWTDESGRFRLSGFVDARYDVIAVAGKLAVELGGVSPGSGVEIELKVP